MMKETAEKTVRFYKHSMNKHVVSAEPSFEPSYDPGVSFISPSGPQLISLKDRPISLC